MVRLSISLACGFICMALSALPVSAHADCVVRLSTTYMKSEQAYIGYGMQVRGYSIKLPDREPEDQNDFFQKLLSEGEYAVVTQYRTDILLFKKEKGKVSLVSAVSGSGFSSWFTISQQFPICPPK